MSDAAEGDANAIRAVFVLTDGRATGSETRLDDLVDVMSRNEVPVSLAGWQGESGARDKEGNSVEKQSLIGTGLAIPTSHPVQVFFIGIGDDADLDIGRILAGATGAEFQGVAEDDLANVLAEFSEYFSRPGGGSGPAPRRNRGARRDAGDTKSGARTVGAHGEPSAGSRASLAGAGSLVRARSLGVALGPDRFRRLCRGGRSSGATLVVRWRRGRRGRARGGADAACAGG